MKFCAYLNELKAVSVFASKDLSRYVLNSVNVQVKELGKPAKLAATDGRRLIVLQSQADQSWNDAGEITISTRFIDLLGKVYPKNPLLRLETTTVDKREVLITSIFGPLSEITISHANALVHGTFPKYKQVVPLKNTKRVPLLASAMNAFFVQSIYTVLQKLQVKDKSVVFQFVGQYDVITAKLPALPYVWAGLMPLRTDGQHAELWNPDFLELEFPNTPPEPTPCTQTPPAAS